MLKCGFRKTLVMFLAMSVLLAPIQADTFDCENGKLVIDFKSLTPLMFAICTDDQKVVEDMLATHCNPNEASHDGYTPLMTAAAKGNKEMVKMLLDASADLHARSFKGETALMAAVCFGFTDIAKMLLAAGAEVNVRTSDNQISSLMIAAARGNAEIVKILVAAGAHVNVCCSSSKETALMIAALAGNKAIVDILVAAGADLHAQNAVGCNALVHAIVAGHRDIAKILYEADTALRLRVQQAKQKAEKALRAVVVMVKKIGDDLTDGVAKACNALAAEDCKQEVKSAEVVTNEVAA